MDFLSTFGLLVPKSGGYDIQHLLIDTFTTDRAAGAVNGTAAEPGPGGNRSVVDAGGNKLSLSAGEALFTATGASTDPRLSYGGITATAGLCFMATIRQNQATTENIIMRAGFDEAATGAVTAECMEFTTAATINARWASSSAAAVGNYVRLTNYQVAVVFLQTQARWFIKGGTWTDWTQLHSQATTKVSGATTVYPAITSFNRTGACADIGVAILPTPFNTDALVLDAANSKILDAM